MPALELKAREKEAIPLGLFLATYQALQPSLFLPGGHQWPHAPGVQRLSGWARLRRAGPVLSGLCFGRGLCCRLAAKKKIQAPKSAEERPSMEMLVELVTEQLAGALFTATVPDINL